MKKEHLQFYGLVQDCGISSASLESNDALEIPRDWSYVFLALTHWYLLPDFRGRRAEWLLPWSWPSVRRPRNHPLVGDRESDGGGGRKRPQPRRSLVWHARYHVSNVQTNLQSQNLQISLAGMQFSLLCIHKLFHIDFFERLMQRLYIFNLVSLYEEMGSKWLALCVFMGCHKKFWTWRNLVNVWYITLLAPRAHDPLWRIERGWL